MLKVVPSDPQFGNFSKLEFCPNWQASEGLKYSKIANYGPQHKDSY